jgi:hypothetical protein
MEMYLKGAHNVVRNKTSVARKRAEGKGARPKMAHFQTSKKSKNLAWSITASFQYQTTRERERERERGILK